MALSGQGADELLGGYSRHRTAALAARVAPAPRPSRAAALSAAARLGAPALRASRTSSCRRSGARVPRAARDSTRAGRRSARARAARATHEIADVRGAPQSARRRRDATATRSPRCFPGRPTRARRRHAALLRPHVDGVLARGARAIPRSPRRGVLRTDSQLAEGRRLTTKYLLKRAARGHRPGQDHRQAQDRVLQCRRGLLVPGSGGPTRSRDYLLAPGPRYAELLDRGAVESLVSAQRAGSPGSGSRAALGPDARGLADRLPSARPRAFSPPRARVVLAG